ncbi:MAG: PQQ-binding-like beta-propeller repeat protein [Planctomycetota bacterium]
MKRTTPFAALILAAAGVAGPAAADDWPQFRGEGARCASSTVAPPVTWNVETGENIAWAADLPGNGVSSPIIVGGRAIVTAASGPENDQLHVLAFDSMTGVPLWRRQFQAAGRTLCYRTSSVAAPTPVSDGKRVYAFYSSNDLVCLDLDGNLLWIRDLTATHPGLGNDLGMAASPVVAGGMVIVQCECQSVSFAAAFDGETGEKTWEIARDKSSNWTSPLAVDYETDGRSLAGVLLQARSGLTLVNAVSGDAVWQESIEGVSISSPTGSDLVLAPAGGLSAFKPTADGFQPVWQSSRVRPSATSPVIADGKAFVIARGGILSAVDLATGKLVPGSKKRLGGSFWATPLAAGGKLFCINESGDAFVIDAGTGDELGAATFGESIYGSPAAADGGMFVRSNSKLWKIATVEQADAGYRGRRDTAGANRR